MGHPAYSTRQWQIVRRKVLVRDDWRCQLCGEPIDQQAVPRSPRSATVDHIVSILDGGAWYEMANLRAAHHVCNSVRANTARAARPMVKYQPPRRW